MLSLLLSISCPGKFSVPDWQHFLYKQYFTYPGINNKNTPSNHQEIVSIKRKVKNTVFINNRMYVLKQIIMILNNRTYINVLSIMITILDIFRSTCFFWRPESESWSDLRSYLCVTGILIFIFRRLRLYVNVTLSQHGNSEGCSVMPYLMEIISNSPRKKIKLLFFHFNSR